MRNFWIIVMVAIITIALIGCGGNDDPAPETFTVTFNANGGSPTPDPQPVEKGKTATEPTGVTKTGYDLIGWYKEEALINQWNFASDTVTVNIMLFAKWNEQPKKQPDTLKTFTLGTADCAVTIKSNDQFTAEQWNSLCNDVVTAIMRGYNNADQWQIYDFEPAFGKDQNATIVLEKNLEYNWQVKSGENRTVHIKVASIDTVKFEDFAQYIAESYPGNG